MSFDQRSTQQRRPRGELETTVANFHAARYARGPREFIDPKGFAYLRDKTVHKRAGASYTPRSWRHRRKNRRQRK
ncbi:hypothetical protein EVAR_60846_1 [Eumeta japonica]|uniref:Uncharacterized protein n=1 Tax=Eumeta variegata TaxID=151549 RepID=A0A4C1Y725_EUMVA|nr:hypothetical protein EVAR_60846_1 [Eumeta japonica]